MTTAPRSDGNPGRLVALSAVHYTLFPIPVITLFWTGQIGMSLTDVMVLQAIFGLTVAALEFPSGYFADRAGYRTSLAVGAGLWLGGWGVYVRGDSFAAIAAAEVVLGAGNAFMSGADRALLWVSLDAAGRAPEYRRWEGRLRAASQAAEALSSAVGGALYAIRPRLPFWLQVPVAVTALVTVLGLRDVRPTPSRVARSHLDRAAVVLRDTFWRHRRLRATIALSVALGLSSFLMVWLIQPVMQARGIAPGWFGPLWAAAHVWLAVVTLASARVVAALGVRATLAGCCLLAPIGYAGLAATDSPWGVAFYLLFMTLRGLQGPILTGVMQQHASPGDRATVLSLAALAFRLTFVLAGPAVGALVDHAGMTTGLAVLAGASAAIGGLALAAFLRVGPEAPFEGGLNSRPASH